MRIKMNIQGWFSVETNHLVDVHTGKIVPLDGMTAEDVQTNLEEGFLLVPNVGICLSVADEESIETSDFEVSIGD